MKQKTYEITRIHVQDEYYRYSDVLIGCKFHSLRKLERKENEWYFGEVYLTKPIILNEEWSEFRRVIFYRFKFKEVKQ